MNSVAEHKFSFHLDTFIICILYPRVSRHATETCFIVYSQTGHHSSSAIRGHHMAV